MFSSYSFKNLFILFSIFIFSLLSSFYKLGENPPGLYFDEASIGVNAYSILTKGVDEHGNKFPLVFKAFGDYKLPVYVYLTSISMFFFGKNEFAVRLPAAFGGTLTVLILYFLIQDLSKLDNKFLSLSNKPKKYALLSSFLFSISPWFSHFNRGAFEVTLATFFFVLALFFINKLLLKKKLILCII